MMFSGQRLALPFCSSEIFIGKDPAGILQQILDGALHNVPFFQGHRGGKICGLEYFGIVVPTF